MEEISGPVIGIALVLSAVFVPTVFIPGITGRLYQQFAVTIAISVILSAFNALTLSPALAALLLKPKTESHGLLRRFFDWFNRMFERATDGYLRWSGVLIRKSAVAFAAAGGGRRWARLSSAAKVPSSFLPGEDQGYMFMHLQLPNASSLERTEAAAAKVEQILMHTPGVKYTTRVAGFSLLSFVSTSYTGFFFVTLDDWKDRTSRADAVSGDRAARESGAREAARRLRPQLPAAGDSRRRHLRRIHLRAGRSRRQGRASSWPTICRSSWPRRPSGRRSRPAWSARSCRAFRSSFSKWIARRR